MNKILMMPCTHTKCEDYNECYHAILHEQDGDCFHTMYENNKDILCELCKPCDFIKKEEVEIQ